MHSAYACNPSHWQEAGSQTLGHPPLLYTASTGHPPLLYTASTGRPLLLYTASSGPALDYLRLCLKRKKEKGTAPTRQCAALSGSYLFADTQGLYLTEERMSQN